MSCTVPCVKTVAVGPSFVVGVAVAVVFAGTKTTNAQTANKTQEKLSKLIYKSITIVFNIVLVFEVSFAFFGVLDHLSYLIKSVLKGVRIVSLVFFTGFFTTPHRLIAPYTFVCFYSNQNLSRRKTYRA